jgi:dihydroneopterin aldolase
MIDSEKITLRNMTYSGYVGVSAREHDVATTIEVDVELYADLKKACKSDHLDDTIDYAEIYDRVGEVISARHHTLLESLAEEITDTLFGLNECEKIITRIRKPRPPLKGACDYAEIEIVRHKANRE